MRRRSNEPAGIFCDSGEERPVRLEWIGSLGANTQTGEAGLPTLAQPEDRKRLGVQECQEVRPALELLLLDTVGEALDEPLEHAATLWSNFGRGNIESRLQYRQHGLDIFGAQCSLGRKDPQVGLTSGMLRNRSFTGLDCVQCILYSPELEVLLDESKSPECVDRPQLDGFFVTLSCVGFRQFLGNPSIVGLVMYDIRTELLLSLCLRRAREQTPEL